jgi:hypothetical protein
MYSIFFFKLERFVQSVRIFYNNEGVKVTKREINFTTMKVLLDRLNGSIYNTFGQVSLNVCP